VTGAAPFTHPVDVRYLEADQQGVVFNMWYLAYFDDAMTAFLAAQGLPYQVMMDAGYDLQLVHTDVDWNGPLRFGDRAAVAVAVTRVGATSFTLRFDVLKGSEAVATGSTVYVVVATDGSGKRRIPSIILNALGSPDDRSGGSGSPAGEGVDGYGRQ
jgi:acyl-CoA thioester hydrolase